MVVRSGNAGRRVQAGRAAARHPSFGTLRPLPRFRQRDVLFAGLLRARLGADRTISAAGAATRLASTTCTLRRFVRANWER